MTQDDTRGKVIDLMAFCLEQAGMDAREAQQVATLEVMYGEKDEEK